MAALKFNQTNFVSCHYSLAMMFRLVSYSHHVRYKTRGEIAEELY